MEVSGLTPTRRDFLTKVLPAGTLACLGCTKLCGLFQSAYAQEAEGRHKFLADSQWSFADVFGFAFAGYYIPILQGLRSQIGEDEFIDMVKEASAESGRNAGKNMARGVPSNDFASFKSWATAPDRFFQHALTWDAVEDSETALEVKITECLWARTFREAQAADIGYAGICHGDFAMASAYNPRMRMERTKTLMQGHDCCNHRWLWES
jgi:predicted hydrocarbon binding protein